MILFSLRCDSEHSFEGWFRDGATYERQAKSSKIACPDCGSTKVDKAPMAPRVARSSTKASEPSPAELRKALVELRRQVEQNCDYVGDKFAEEARRIHYGEAEAHNIYGESSDEEARELADEGIAFARIPWTPLTDA